ncbi:general stress protein [Lentzea sp. NPDC051838]|uniref:general stress protein n=1 Tax=Lentzea sp. NPDC051838 TaxID=3154849 RepID=UPI0034252EB3
MEIEQRASESSLLASFTDYADAQRLVGEGVRTVEQVTGRMTRGRAAVSGAAGGAWFGVLIGLLFGLFTTGAAWVWLLLVSLLIRAFWGGVFGFVAHWSTRGRRDFSSVMTLQARAARAARYVL